MTTNEGGGFWTGKNWDKFELEIKQSQIGDVGCGG